MKYLLRQTQGIKPSSHFPLLDFKLSITKKIYQYYNILTILCYTSDYSHFENFPSSGDFII